MANGETSPGWKQPLKPTDRDRASVQGVIESMNQAAYWYAEVGHHNAAARARTHAGVWRERLEMMG